MSQSNMPLLEALLTAGAASDWDAVTACVGPDFVIVEPDELPYGGEHHGPAGFRNMIELYQSTWVDPQFDMQVLGEIGSTLIMKGVLRAEAASTGRRVEASVAEFFTVRDGRIVASEVFYRDLASVLAAIGTEAHR
jgi:ketosteroid isomerase-like protein